MNNALTYRGYTARVEFDPRDEILVGRVLGLADVISFHGTQVADLIADFHNAIDHYLADCEATGRKPEKPFSGKMMLRVKPEIHAAASIAAQLSGKSLNQWAEEVIEHAAR